MRTVNSTTMSLIWTRLSKRPTVRFFCMKLQQQTCSSSSMTKSSIMASSNFGFDPYDYTNGRWLRADASQRDARRIKFDFPALCQKAISSAPGAKGISECTKVEGNFNRAFIISLDNGTKVVARVPLSVAGPSRLVTNSEVATMAYRMLYGNSLDRARSTDKRFHSSGKNNHSYSSGAGLER